MSQVNVEEKASIEANAEEANGEEKRRARGSAGNGASKDLRAKDEESTALTVTLGQDVFFHRPSGEIVAAKVISEMSDKKKVAIVWWSEGAISKSCGEKNIAVGFKKGCIWPNLEELKIAIKIESKGLTV